MRSRTARGHSPLHVSKVTRRNLHPGTAERGLASPAVAASAEDANLQHDAAIAHAQEALHLAEQMENEKAHHPHPAWSV